MPVSFYTIAVRMFHYGRYGTGADDIRLRPIYLNDPGFVRGYDYVYYGSGGCSFSSSINGCEANSRFSGTRAIVGNIELRVPLLRPFGVDKGLYGPIPVELALFGDAGAAWNGRGTSVLASVPRAGISSAGAAIRVGLGYVAAEFDIIRPFQRPGAGWTFGFNLIPGW
jgi:outer membrane protein assembly factor BamA